MSTRSETKPTTTATLEDGGSGGGGEGLVIKSTPSLASRLNNRADLLRRIFSFHKTRNPKDYIDLRCSSKLFHRALQPPPLWTSFPNSNYATLQSLLDRLDELRGDEESSGNVPSLLFIDDAHGGEGKYVWTLPTINGSPKCSRHVPIFLNRRFVLSPEKIQQLSQSASSVLIQDDNDSFKFVRLKDGVTWPLERLAEGLLMSSEGQGDPREAWEGNKDSLERLNIGSPRDDNKKLSQGELYHACCNGNGLHLISGKHSCWSWSHQKMYGGEDDKITVYLGFQDAHSN